MSATGPWFLLCVTNITSKRHRALGLGFLSSDQLTGSTHLSRPGISHLLVGLGGQRSIVILLLLALLSVLLWPHIYLQPACFFSRLLKVLILLPGTVTHKTPEKHNNGFCIQSPGNTGFKESYHSKNKVNNPEYLLRKI